MLERDGPVRTTAAVGLWSLRCHRGHQRRRSRKDANNVVGTIAGGVVGGVLGHQVGGGSGKDIATIAGALGGAYAGNRVQNSMAGTTEYHVVVRLESGTTQTIKLSSNPLLKVGERVRVENNTVVRL